MNNEPIAWKVIETDDDGSFITFTQIEPVWANNATPLYTQPAKELTDEEIALIWANYAVPMTGMDFKKVVEAILRKAQEK